MNLLYMVFGNEFKNHLQAHFSIYSFLTQRNEIASVNIITDCPEYYKSLGNLVTLITVDEATLKSWRGPHDFFWRIKIKALELISNKFPNEPVLYIDSDTFLFQPLHPLILGAESGKAYMHELENLLSGANSKTERKMWAQVGGKTFGGITIQNNHGMWNAGVVLSPNQKNGEEFDLAIRLCDDMCAAGVTRRLIEQFALSVALQELYKLEPVSDYIAHYWSNKTEWNNLINQFLMSASFQSLSFEKTLEAMQALNLSSIAIKKETRNTSLRLQKLVNKFFPPRNVAYLPAGKLLNKF